MGRVHTSPDHRLRSLSGRSLRMVVSDLDGTLFGRDHVFRPQDLAMLVTLGRKGCVRCIATGRSLYSARRVLPLDLPIDYLVFSSGAGILDWRDQTLIDRRSMTPTLAAQTFKLFRRRNWNFMVHQPVPMNHHFVYYRHQWNNYDFEDRICRYRRYAVAGVPRLYRPEEACQFLAVVPAGKQHNHIAETRIELPGANVIRTTSPLDGFSTWIEVFGKDVSKSKGIRFLSQALAIERDGVLALGNDYNDEDMLDWSAAAYVVEGAPTELCLRFPVVSWRGGLTEAVESSGFVY